MLKNGCERNYFGFNDIVNTGEADAMVTGYSRSYPNHD